jgi:hypothetical protein
MFDVLNVDLSLKENVENSNSINYIFNYFWNKK